MTIETQYNLSPNPVWYFSDSEGNPLANGKVFCFKATEHSTEKAVYKDREGTTVWVQPIILDSGGHPVDPTSGVIQPIYWASDENYYLVVKKEDDSPYYDEDNFNAPVNFLIQQEIKPTFEETDRNHILNSQFRFFDNKKLEGASSDLPPNEDVVIADEGWTFRRNNEEGNIIIEFKQFSMGQSDVDNTPTYYMNVYETSSGAGGQTELDVQYALGNTQDFSEQTMSLGLSIISNTSSLITVLVKQNFGTGGSPSSEVVTGVGTISADGTFSEKSINFEIPSVSGKSKGTDNNDKTSLIFRMPLNEAFNIGFTNFQLNLGEILRNFDKKSFYQDRLERNAYESEVASVENAYYTEISIGNKKAFYNDTGFVKKMLRKNIPDGYLPLDGTTYVTTDKVDAKYNSYDVPITYERLYNQWETEFGNGNIFGYGDDGFFPLIYTNNIIITNEKKETAITAWADNNTGFSFSTERVGGDKGFSEFAITVDDSINKLEQATEPKMTLSVVNTSPGTVSAATSGNLKPESVVVETIIPPSPTQPQELFIYFNQISAIEPGHYFLISSTTTDYYVWFGISEVGNDPAIGGRTGIQIKITYNESNVSIMRKIKSALEATGGFSCDFLYRLIFRNKNDGAVTAPDPANSLGRFVRTHVGSPSVQAYYSYVSPRASYSSGTIAGYHFLISSTIGNYYVWFRVDGLGTDPAIGGRTGIVVDLNASDNQLAVLWKIKNALEGKQANKIVCNAASTLSGSEYFLANNSSINFYVWYTVDSVGTDPQIPLKTGIKIELLSTDSANDVATKTAKAISKYYYKVPDYRGYFLRAQAVNSDVDEGFDIRNPTESGIGGNEIGTSQIDTNKAHHHLLPSALWGSQSTDGLSTSSSIAGRSIGWYQYYELSISQVPFVSGEGGEARPRNKSLLYCVKF